MPYYAVIDTNVLVSSLLSSNYDSATVQIVDKIFSGDIIPLFSAEILAEYNEVLRRKKFKFSNDFISSFIAAIEKSGLCIVPEETNEALPDIKDLPFYDVVMERRNDNAYLVTGNIKHFPVEPFIVTAKQMLEIINKGNA